MKHLLKIQNSPPIRGEDDLFVKKHSVVHLATATDLPSLHKVKSNVETRLAALAGLGSQILLQTGSLW
jgi:hypothetical protein